MKTGCPYFLLRVCTLCACFAVLHGCSGAAEASAVPRAFTKGPEGEERFIAFERDPSANAGERNDDPADRAVPECWQPLAERLAADGMDPGRVSALLRALGSEIPQLPMGTKANELYTAKYLKKQPTPGAKPQPSNVYKGVPTEQNAALCRDFLAEHAEIFARAEAEYGVPRAVAVALLFVETRLGRQVGKHQAAWCLASMAGAGTPAHVPDYIVKLPGMNNERRTWLAGRIREKADWAYAELKALIRYADSLERDPLEIPGSIYGAVGLCQFMPSNIPLYAMDGDGDGSIDLHGVPDAVMSLANYLSKNGWKRQGMTEELRRKALRRYNNSTVYVNTILALARLVGNKPAEKK